MRLQLEAAAVADEMLRFADGEEPLMGSQRKRRIPAGLRTRFINVRLAFIRLGLCDPVLARFDSYTVPQEETGVIARQLAAIAESLQ